jgi:hypothetical protein
MAGAFNIMKMIVKLRIFVHNLIARSAREQCSRGN